MYKLCNKSGNLSILWKQYLRRISRYVFARSQPVRKEVAFGNAISHWLSPRWAIDKQQFQLLTKLCIQSWTILCNFIWMILVSSIRSLQIIDYSVDRVCCIVLIFFTSLTYLLLLVLFVRYSWCLHIKLISPYTWVSQKAA